jgi:hypothetical protein
MGQDKIQPSRTCHSPQWWASSNQAPYSTFTPPPNSLFEFSIYQWIKPFIRALMI